MFGKIQNKILQKLLICYEIGIFWKSNSVVCNWFWSQCNYSLLLYLTVWHQEKQQNNNFYYIMQLSKQS